MAANAWTLTAEIVERACTRANVAVAMRLDQ